MRIGIQRIGIQLLSLRPGTIGGVEGYVHRLLRAMLPSLGGDRLVLFLRPEAAETEFWRSLCGDARVESVIEDPARHYGEGYERWNLELLSAARLDVVFFPLSFFYPRPLPIPVAMHIGDIQHEYFPENFSAEQLAWRRERIPESVRLADAVMTDSHFSARCIRERYGEAGTEETGTEARPTGGPPKSDRSETGPPKGGAETGPPKGERSDAGRPVRGGMEPGRPQEGGRIHVVPLAGFDEEEIASQAPPSPPAECRGRPFILYPAGDWPHKNHETLLRALRLMADRGRPERLVLTTMVTPSGGELQRRIEQLGLADRVHGLGCVPTGRLIALYRAASLMAFPSLFEGFGLPVVEAMQLGCPVVASRAEAVLEVGGGAPLHCENDAGVWAEAMMRVADEGELRGRLTDAGRRRAAVFSWDRCAEAHLRILREIAAGRGRGTCAAPSSGRAPAAR